MLPGTAIDLVVRPLISAPHTIRATHCPSTPDAVSRRCLAESSKPPVCDNASIEDAVLSVPSLLCTSLPTTSFAWATSSNPGWWWHEQRNRAHSVVQLVRIV